MCKADPFDKYAMDLIVRCLRDSIDRVKLAKSKFPDEDPRRQRLETAIRTVLEVNEEVCRELVAIENRELPAFEE